MATWQHLRSSTANKRPTTSLADGRIAINTNTASPGLFFKDSAGTGIVKVGPVHVGTTAPNSVPASGGSSGNYTGEQWLDTSVSPAQMKVWNGSTWVGIVADELPVSKLQDGAARQLIQTDAAGTGVEWTSNVDVPGTLDVTSTATFDSIAQHPLGTAGAPTITFSGDTNTGIYSPGADQVAISTNGTGRLFVDASGNVGLATSSPISVGVAGMPAVTLASATSGRSGALYWSDTGLTNKASSYWFGSVFNFGTETNHPVVFTQNASEKMRLTATGLGLGTSSPDELLTLSSSGTTGTAIRIENTSTGGYKWGIYSIGSAASLAPVGSLAFRDSTNGATRLVIDSSGRVGIGTTTPGSFSSSARNLVVEAATSAGITISESTGGGTASIYFAATSSFPNKAYISSEVANSNLIFATGGGTERARIDSSGRLLVGTSSGFGNSTFTKAEFVNSASYTNIVVGRTDGATGSGSTIGVISFLSNAGGTGEYHASIAAEMDAASGSGDKPGRLVFSTTADGASSPTERMRIGQNGHVNIGQTASGLENNRSFSFQTTGAGQATFNHSTANANGDHWIIFGYNSTQIGSITQNGTTGTSYSTSSDYRLKENVVPLTEAVARVQQLKPSQFNFIADPDRTVDGFIAHEAQAVVPECVTGEKDAVDADGNPVYQGIDQSKLVPLLTAALQEALAEIESLKARLDTAGI